MKFWKVLEVSIDLIDVQINFLNDEKEESPRDKRSHFINRPDGLYRGSQDVSTVEGILRN